MKPLSKWEKKVGDHRYGPHSRIWIEGPRLTAAGFTRGVEFTVKIANGAITLRAEKAKVGGARVVSGKGDHPIIDLSGAWVSEALGGAPRMCCTFHAGRIVITPLSVL